MANAIHLQLHHTPSAIINRIINNRQVGMFTAVTWHRYFQKFTPMDNGGLINNVSYEPYKIHYNSPYAHYIHEGIKYIDPQINASGWFDPQQGRWYSHRGVIKQPTSEQLNYSRLQSPLAQSHWEVPAYKAYKKQVANEISAYLRRL